MVTASWWWAGGRFRRRSLVGRDFRELCGVNSGLIDLLVVMHVNCRLSLTAACAHPWRSTQNNSVLYHKVLRPLAGSLVERCVPMNIAPNVITLAGLICSVISTACVVHYAPDMTTPIDYRILTLFGINLFLYQTLDNMDGQQARRTGTGSPLGQLFDHGCDAVNTTLTTIVIAAVLELGIEWCTPLLIMNLLTFYMATWAEYHTGILYLGVINGSDDGLSIGYAGIFLTVFLPNFWVQGVIIENQIVRFFINLVVGPNVYSFYLRYGDIAAFVCIVIAVVTCLGEVKRLQAAGVQVSDALHRGAPAFATFLCSFWWLRALQDMVMPAVGMLGLFAVGFVFARITCAVILAHVVKVPLTWQHQSSSLIIIVPGTIAYLSSWVLPVPLAVSPTSVWLVFLVATAVLGHYAYVASSEIARILDIDVFSINRQRSQAAASAAAAAAAAASAVPSAAADHSSLA
jgi:ethanolaminephosphotransferase